MAKTLKKDVFFVFSFWACELYFGAMDNISDGGMGWDGWQNQVLFDKTWRRASRVLHTFKFAKSPPDLPENSAQIFDLAQ